MNRFMIFLSFEILKKFMLAPGCSGVLDSAFFEEATQPRYLADVGCADYVRYQPLHLTLREIYDTI
jgi:hypothetical protein